MHPLFDVITALAANSPQDSVEQLSALLRRANGPEDVTQVRLWANTAATKDRVADLIQAWRQFDIPSIELAGMLLGASHAYHAAKAEESVELVWTGPSSELVSTRKTEQALLQVVSSAQNKLFLTSFVAYNVGSIMAAILDALTRNVSVSMLLESSEAHGGGVTIDVIGNMREALPGARIYFWGGKADEFSDGKVHAKVAVADEAICFISSANLTGHAMEKNMEAGVLIEGGSIPEKLHRHLEALIVTRQLSAVDGG